MSASDEHPEANRTVPEGASATTASLPRCRDCRWWGREHEAIGDGPNVEPMIAGDHGVCLLTETRSLEAEHRESRALVWEGDRYTGILVTAPDFGCVQFQPRRPRALKREAQNV